MIALPAKASKALGQRFLVRKDIAGRIVDALGVRAGETVVEIGPGRGALTRLLMDKTARLILVELDREIARWWREHSSPDRVRVIEEDARGLDLTALSDSPAAVVGNLPYHITAEFLANLLGATGCWSRAVLMVQAEVADRLAAGPGSRRRGALSVFVEYHASVEHLFTVPRSAFRPIPKVAGGVVRLTPRPAPVGVPWDVLRPVVRAVFTGRRKRVANALSVGLPTDIESARRAVSSAGVDEALRPVDLALQDFAGIARAT